MASSTETHQQGVEVETGIGKIKNIPFKDLGWVIIGLVFAYLVYNMTTSQSKALEAVAKELPRQTVIMEQQSKTLEKILDKH